VQVITASSVAIMTPTWFAQGHQARKHTCPQQRLREDIRLWYEQGALEGHGC
jgi:hypothetical protein